MYGYRERDELKRQAFQAQLNSKQLHQIVYVDEAGIDNRDKYPYGYCEIGQRFYALKSGKRTERVSTDCSSQAGQKEGLKKINSTDLKDPACESSLKINVLQFFWHKAPRQISSICRLNLFFLRQM